MIIKSVSWTEYIPMVLVLRWFNLILMLSIPILGWCMGDFIEGETSVVIDILQFLGSFSISGTSDDNTC